MEFNFGHDILIIKSLISHKRVLKSGVESNFGNKCFELVNSIYSSMWLESVYKATDIQ